MSVRTQPSLKPEKEARQWWKNTLSFKGRVPFPSRKLAENREEVNRVSVNSEESSRKESPHASCQPLPPVDEP